MNNGGECQRMSCQQKFVHGVRPHGKHVLHYVRDKQQREDDFLIAKDGEPYMLVECKASMDEPMSPALPHFQKVLKAPYAFQVAVDGECAGVNPLEYKDRPIRLSAADFLSVLI